MATKKRTDRKARKSVSASKGAKVAAPAAAPVMSETAKALAAPKAKAESARDQKSKGRNSGKKDKKTADAPDAKRKMVRDSFSMPAQDYAMIALLKSRTLASGTVVKKSQLLRAGLAALVALTPAHLIDVISTMPELKTGRPGKKK